MMVPDHQKVRSDDDDDDDDRDYHQQCSSRSVFGALLRCSKEGRCHSRYVHLLVLSILLSLMLSTTSPCEATRSASSSTVRTPTMGWTNLTDLYNEGPPARVFAASSSNAPVPPPYPPDSRTGLVLFGGTGSSTKFTPLFNDVWVLNGIDLEGDGRAWTQIPIIPSLPSPQPRCLSAAAVDPYGVLYIFGGFDGNNWYNGESTI